MGMEFSAFLRTFSSFFFFIADVIVLQLTTTPNVSTSVESMSSSSYAIRHELDSFARNPKFSTTPHPHGCFPIDFPALVILRCHENALAFRRNETELH